MSTKSGETGMTNQTLADARWKGNHGIGRFASEVLPRLNRIELLNEGPAPLSMYNLIWQSYFLHRNKTKFKAFFSPGFNPTLSSPIPVIFTVHDLIHLFFQGKTAFFKKAYYATIMKKAAKQAYKILTVSDYSKQAIVEWANLPETSVAVVGNGISESFTLEGERYQSGYPYFLCVANAKQHKNLLRLLQAFANARVDKSVQLILVAQPTAEVMEMIQKNRLINRVVFPGLLSDIQLASYYRGAIAVLFPSLYEGFGLPVIEGMACGAPVLTSTVTALPEIAGGAALLVDPYQVDSIQDGIEEIMDSELRGNLIARGIEQAQGFSWDKVARKVQKVLDEV